MSSSPSPGNDPLVAALERANRMLTLTANPAPFSDAAFAVLRAIISTFIADLVAESRRVSERYRADTVSAAHVERASEYLVASSTRALFRHIGTLGGVFLGAGLSTLLSMATAATFPRLPTLLAAVTSLVGAFMVALHVAKE